MGPRDDATKKWQSVLCPETIPKFWTEDVAVVWRDGEWVQTGTRGMAVFFLRHAAAHRAGFIGNISAIPKNPHFAV